MPAALIAVFAARAIAITLADKVILILSNQRTIHHLGYEVFRSVNLIKESEHVVFSYASSCKAA